MQYWQSLKFVRQELILTIILFRLTPIFLLRKQRENRSFNLFIIIFSFLSFLSDLVCFVMVSSGIETMDVISLYFAIQPILIFLLLNSGYTFEKKQFSTLGTLTLSISISLIYFSFVAPNEYILSLIWGFSNLFSTVLSLYVILKIAHSIEISNPYFPKKITPILGLFIYTSFSFVPQVSHFFQMVSDEKVITADFYFVFMLAGNFLRDTLFAIYGFSLILSNNKR
jgi:hypothetical protein